MIAWWAFEALAKGWDMLSLQALYGLLSDTDEIVAVSRPMITVRSTREMRFEGTGADGRQSAHVVRIAGVWRWRRCAQPEPVISDARDEPWCVFHGLACQPETRGCGYLIHGYPASREICPCRGFKDHAPGCREAAGEPDPQPLAAPPPPAPSAAPRKAARAARQLAFDMTPTVLPESSRS